MITLAVAALAISSPSKIQNAPILPLYDLVTTVNGSNLTANFMLSNNWNPTSLYGNFRVYYVNGDTSHFSPNGNWVDVTPYTGMSISGNVGTFYYTFSTSSPRGTLWIQYAGGPSDSPNGAETSFVAAQYGGSTQAGHGSLPGMVVPICRTTPSRQNVNIPIAFTINSPWSGSWDGPGPSFWVNNGQGNSPYPGNGWQNLSIINLSATNASQTVTVTGQTNNNAGYYCIGVQETYTPSESYNIHNSQWTEFSGVIRAYNVGG
jgi:hypothetical protein